jgi:hypothetical protein
LSRVVPRLEVLLLSVKQADLRDVVEKDSENDCTSTVAETADCLFPTPSTSSAMKTTTDREPDDPESGDKRDIQMEYCCD